MEDLISKTLGDKPPQEQYSIKAKQAYDQSVLDVAERRKKMDDNLTTSDVQSQSNSMKAKSIEMISSKDINLSQSASKDPSSIVGYARSR